MGLRCGLDLPEPVKVNESEMPSFEVEDLDDCSRLLIEEVFAKDFDLLGFPRLEKAFCERLWGSSDVIHLLRRGF